MTVSFAIIASLQPLKGEVVYHPSEYALDFIPAQWQDVDRRKGKAGTFSLLIGQDLTLEVALQTGLALFVTGYSPSSAWTSTSLRPPEAPLGGLHVEFEEQAVFSGAGFMISEAVRTRTIKYDPGNGWLCVGDPDVARPISLVQFASNTIAVLDSGLLLAVWLRPAST